MLETRVALYLAVSAGLNGAFLKCCECSPLSSARPIGWAIIPVRSGSPLSSTESVSSYPPLQKTTTSALSTPPVGDELVNLSIENRFGESKSLFRSKWRRRTTTDDDPFERSTISARPYCTCRAGGNDWVRCASDRSVSTAESGAEPYPIRFGHQHVHKVVTSRPATEEPPGVGKPARTFPLEAQAAKAMITPADSLGR